MSTAVQTTVSSSKCTATGEILLVEDPSPVVHYPDPDYSLTHVNYFKDAEEPPPDTTNCTLSAHEIRVKRRTDDGPNVCKKAIRVQNIRGREHKYTIEKQGFTVRELKSAMLHWDDEAELRRVYFPEVDELLKKTLGAKFTYQYEHLVRTQTLEQALVTDSEGAADIYGPVRRVHIDETPGSARLEYNHWLPKDKPDNKHLVGRHFGIYNVWKPIKQIRRDPLCLCDTRTVADENMRVGKVMIVHIGDIETIALRPPAGERRHEFSYVREQKPEEALVFRIFDSRVDGGVDGHAFVEDGKKSHGVPHTSFVDPGTEHGPARQSVEVRSFCVF